MKILTLVRQVPDAEGGLRLNEGNVDLTGAPLVMDTMDEYGVEQALRLREAAGAGEVEVIALAVGPAKNEEVLRSALALGADRAVHVKADVALDPVALSKVVAALAKSEGADLVLCGGRQSDWDSEALGGAVAERLGWPQITWTTELVVEGGTEPRTAKGRHDTERGSEAFAVRLPAVVTTQQGLCEPRFPTLPNIVKARKKELRSEALESFGVAPVVRTTGAELQPRQRLRRIVQVDGDPGASVAELAGVLRGEMGQAGGAQ
ncbi:MAG TPA: electron transfer flavoprotein subunit beta/FixA family protein [Acidobacteriaceae bacterium]|nr:electron transfer flavoprotein subunit beta/FixA family protein [Acidobacteriaceae bacterium]